MALAKEQLGGREPICIQSFHQLLQHIVPGTLQLAQLHWKKQNQGSKDKVSAPLDEPEVGEIVGASLHTLVHNADRFIDCKASMSRLTSTVRTVFR